MPVRHRPAVLRANLVTIAALTVLLTLIGALSWDRLESARRTRTEVRHTNDVIRTIDNLEEAVLAAETGQRGYLLTGSDEYLQPYTVALAQVGLLEGDLRTLTLDNVAQQERLRQLVPLIQRKLEELAQTVQLRRTVSLEAALQVMQSGLGRTLMMQVSGLLAEMGNEERELLAARQAAAEVNSRVVIWLVPLLTVLAAGLLLWAGHLLRRAWAQTVDAEANQRRLAARLRTSLDSLSQGVGVFDGDFVLTDSNDCFRELLDVPAAVVADGARYGSLAAVTAGLLETEDEVRHGRRDPGEVIVFERRRRDGRELEVRRTAMPGGGFVLTLSDMTKRAQTEAVLREAQKMQAIGHLTGGLAHDFNNLLTVMLGNLEFIRARPDDTERVLVRAERATWAAERGASLTKQLLAFARKQPLEPVALDLGTVVPELVPLLRRTLGETVDVRYVETARLWPALADPAQLESALLNLALNARDAMPLGGRLTIEVANKMLDADYAAQHAEVTAGDYVMVAVSDTGHGMAPEVMERAFEPFFTTKPDGRGTGLGLAMVFGFVKQSRGHVKMYSEVGEGTTIRLYLPRATATAPLPERAAAPIALPTGQGTVLVVEDEPAVREVASAMLRELGYGVVEAENGENALVVFGAHAEAIDLVLTDVVLPGPLRGREVAERIHALRPEVRVLFMSGYTENSIMHNGRLDEGVHLISKPFTRERLAQKVAEVLARR